MIENAAAVLRDVHIGPAVGIVVPHSYTHAIASGGDAGLFGDLRECPVAIVAVEGIAEGWIRGEKIALAAVHQIDVHPAIVVVVQKGATRAGGLGQEVIRRTAVLMTPGESAGRRGHFLKERLQSGFGESRWREETELGQKSDAAILGQTDAAGHT